jgi:hypothetical protein
MDWLAELAEAYPDEAWLQPVDGDEEDFEPRPWHELYFQAFDALRYDRPYGALGGQMPISYVAISTYARDHGIVGNEFGRFRRLLNQIDEAYLAAQAEADKAAKEGG